MEKDRIEIKCNHTVAPGGDGRIIHADGCNESPEISKNKPCKLLVNHHIDESKPREDVRVSAGT